MRETVGIPAGFLVYSLSTIILLLLVQFLNISQDWDYIITAIISIISLKITFAAIKNFSTNTGVTIVAFMIAIFWLISLGFDMFEVFDKVLEFFRVGSDSPNVFDDFKELAQSVWDTRVCAAISFVMALGTLGK